MLSSEGTQNVELLVFQDPIRSTREIRERSNDVGTSSLSAIAKLIEASMTFRRDTDYLAAFKAFIRAILVNIDVSEITSNRAE